MFKKQGLFPKVSVRSSLFSFSSFVISHTDLFSSLEKDIMALFHMHIGTKNSVKANQQSESSCKIFSSGTKCTKYLQGSKSKNAIHTFHLKPIIET